MALNDREIDAHKEWLGFLQPVGVVVSPPALIKAQAFVNRDVIDQQQALQALVVEEDDADGNSRSYVEDFHAFTRDVLGWMEGDLLDAPEDLAVALTDYEDVLDATWVVKDAPEAESYSLLIRREAKGADLDAVDRTRKGWQASPQSRMERLLRDKEVSAGVLFNETQLRIVYSPRGETSGHLTFPVEFMSQVAGRLVFGAMLMLLEADRIFEGRLLPEQRLPALLEESRKYQAEVSTHLAEQVLDALWELLRGFQAADEAVDGRLLGETSREDPQHIYGALATVLLRMVFVLYAEDRGLMPQDDVYQSNYSVAGMYERLREDAGLYPDTMDQRYGAWAGLLSLFRLVFDGGHHHGLSLPPRHGQLFNPDEYPFLEGRPQRVLRVMGERIEPPRVSDGVVFRVLQGLLVLRGKGSDAGERLSYRALDVEQIGSVYEAMMGFEVERAFAPSIALKPSGGAASKLKGHVVVDLQKLLATAGGKRATLLKDEANCDVSGAAATALKEAGSIPDLVAALDRQISPRTKSVLPPGSLYLQPGEERRRTGSHYTPRELTEPIVRTTLRPVLAALGEHATPEQILDLKVCDLAMGSGAFLVETCRHLADQLLVAWEHHRCLPKLPPDEDPVLHARRLVAQRCLYGVDKNPFAVNLAKLSLWLVTLARDHAFTFLDHALKHGDSLVGLTREQIGAFHWSPAEREWGPLFAGVTASVDEASEWRTEIQALDEGDYDQRREAWQEAEEVLADTRLIGDLCVAAFFGAEKQKEREALRQRYSHMVTDWRAGRLDRFELEGIVEQLRAGARPIPALHWEIEFPEVFEGGDPGFDAFLGNPPFLGGTRVSTEYGMSYFAYLKGLHPPAGHLCDLVAHFFRRAFRKINSRGTLGLIATNSIGQGDTREGGLTPIAQAGGSIYSARSRLKWPGAAAVVVSVVHIGRQATATATLDGKDVSRVSAFLLPGNQDATPAKLAAQPYWSLGSKIYGQGFLFADRDPSCTPVDVMQNLLDRSPECRSRVLPYLGGKEFNTHPRQMGHRFCITLSDLKTEDDLLPFLPLAEIVRAKVRPGRELLGSNPNNVPLKRRWWAFQAHRPDLYRAMAGLPEVIVRSRIGNAFAFGLVSSRQVLNEKLVVFASNDLALFQALQSRVHEVWARTFSSTLKDDMQYTPSDCFETFPLAPTVGLRSTVGEHYHRFRAALMIRNDEGLTKTYNRFHDPDERSPDILRLRELHAEMDRAVLDAYGWKDISTDCEFLLDYEVDEDDEPGARRKKKPWRYRWPDEVHDEVLARLLDLNQKRAAEEKIVGTKTRNPRAPKPKTEKPAPKPSTQTNIAGLPLFDRSKS